MLYIKVSDKTTCYRKNREIILNRPKEYYENNKERLRKQARNKHRKLSEKGKDIKREYGRKKYKNISKENKQRLKEFKKKIVKVKLSINNFFSLFAL